MSKHSQQPLWFLNTTCLVRHFCFITWGISIWQISWSSLRDVLISRFSLCLIRPFFKANLVLLLAFSRRLITNRKKTSASEACVGCDAPDGWSVWRRERRCENGHGWMMISGKLLLCSFRTNPCSYKSAVWNDSGKWVFFIAMWKITCVEAKQHPSFEDATSLSFWSMTINSNHF